jgi:hypothetical protein
MCGSCACENKANLQGRDCLVGLRPACHDRYGQDRTIGPLPGSIRGAIVRNKANFQRPRKVTSACEAGGYE